MKKKTRRRKEGEGEEKKKEVMARVWSSTAPSL
jgi:hypothetical protein